MQFLVGIYLIFLYYTFDILVKVCETRLEAEPGLVRAGTIQTSAVCSLRKEERTPSQPRAGFEAEAENRQASITIECYVLNIIIISPC